MCMADACFMLYPLTASCDVRWSCTLLSNCTSLPVSLTLSSASTPRSQPLKNCLPVSSPPKRFLILKLQKNHWRVMKITVFFAALFLLDFFTCFHADLQYPLPDIEDAEFIEHCVRAHNTFRSKVNPPASNMFRMSWDAALAKTAKAWAKKCNFNHNTYLEMPGKMHPTFTHVGENIWTGTARIFSVGAALRAWFNEVSSYDFSTNKCTDKCGHYTQVVWAESYKVGCAVHFCNTVENFPGLFKAAHFVCNYGPAGNYPRKPYKEGQPCSRCSNDKCVDKLCENTEREKLISYANWYPDWDTPSQPPRPHPPQPPVPSYIPPAEHPHPSCDQYCLTVLVLRPLFLVLSTGAVLLVQQQFPHIFFYE